MVCPELSQELGPLRELARRWAKIVSQRAYGDDGLDIDFRTMEQIAAVAAQKLNEGTLELLRSAQNDRQMSREYKQRRDLVLGQQPHDGDLHPHPLRELASEVGHHAIHAAKPSAAERHSSPAGGVRRLHVTKSRHAPPSAAAPGSACFCV